MDPNLLLFRSNRPRLEPEERMEEEEQNVDLSKSKNVLLVPYGKRVSDRLRNIAARYGVRSWFSFSGRLGDGFSTTYKDQLHLSKSWHAVYRAVCSCRREYIGKSDRNLKVRVSEHKKPNSSSSLSNHLRISDAHTLESNRTEKSLRKSICFIENYQKVWLFCLIPPLFVILDLLLNSQICGLLVGRECVHISLTMPRSVSISIELCDVPPVSMYSSGSVSLAIGLSLSECVLSSFLVMRLGLFFLSFQIWFGFCGLVPFRYLLKPDQVLWSLDYSTLSNSRFFAILYSQDYKFFMLLECILSSCSFRFQCYCAFRVNRGREHDEGIPGFQNIA